MLPNDRRLFIVRSVTYRLCTSSSMSISSAPSAYDNSRWTPVTDITLLHHLNGERDRLANDESLIPHILHSGGPLLDYGCGPGYVAGGVSGVEAYAFDPSPVMRESARQYLPSNHVFDRVEDIPKNTFSSVWCCLVLCIVDDDQVKAVLETVRAAMMKEGTALFTICNPALCQTPETRLDFRFPSEDFDPNKDGLLPKWKKEGNYGVTERHRPLEYYWDHIQRAGYKLIQTLSTPHYEFKDRTVPGDFIAFKCSPV